MKKMIGTYLRFSLRGKITIYFVIFDLFIGYFTFVLSTIDAAKNEMDLAYETAVQIFHEITGTQVDDFIAGQVDRENDDLTRLNNIVLKTFSNYGTIRPTVYCLNRNRNRLNSINSDAHAFFSEGPAPSKEVPDLDGVIGLVSSLLHSTSTALARYNEEKKGFDLLSRFQSVVQGIMIEKPFISINNIGATEEQYVIDCG
ncbi:MAG TPA: hypothetical protein PLM53_00790 [Spirochaetota bacterium]|nr:hypothetical protein [Spirochaetota bacterium]HQF06777.1 hypothetical protein [Spirochaetota bacterium]HQH95604.1 hypothetical protein [Spirochaetota bacterium]HQJ69182.1 hypothetical protein [Spirochaetota bacterium]